MLKKGKPVDDNSMFKSISRDYNGSKYDLLRLMETNSYRFVELIMKSDLPFEKRVNYLLSKQYDIEFKIAPDNNIYDSVHFKVHKCLFNAETTQEFEDEIFKNDMVDLYKLSSEDYQDKIIYLINKAIQNNAKNIIDHLVETYGLQECLECLISEKSNENFVKFIKDKIFDEDTIDYILLFSAKLKNSRCVQELIQKKIKRKNFNILRYCTSTVERTCILPYINKKYVTVESVNAASRSILNNKEFDSYNKGLVNFKLFQSTSFIYGY